MREYYSTVETKSTTQEPLSVTAALMLAKGALEAFPVHLIGEVSEVNAKPGYKAVYFTVKDKQSTLPCMMWINRYQASGITISQGDLVEMTGRFSLYAPKGRMNFAVSNIRFAGEGELRKRIADLGKLLRSEGLTDQARKKPVPAYAETVGLVTSPRGDAVHDVLRTLRRRFPLASIKLAGVPVEGAQAARGIADALALLDKCDCDVILLVRGGGSLEDLMPFNDEMLARTIAACETPIVTGIGHEPDTTIADLVSDFRASTPTGAAEAVSPNADTIREHLDRGAKKMQTHVSSLLKQADLQLSRYATRPLFTDPARLFSNEAMGLDICTDKLSRSLPKMLESQSTCLDALEHRLRPVLTTSLAGDAIRLHSATERLHAIGKSFLKPYDHEFTLKASRLEDLSPLSVLTRGYSMAQTENGHVVTSVKDVKTGDHMTVTVSDGHMECTIGSIKKR